MSVGEKFITKSEFEAWIKQFERRLLAAGISIPALSISHKHTEDDLILSDTTINNATPQRHGFCPKLPNDPTLFLRGDGQFAAPEISAGLDADIQFEEQNDILFYHEPMSKWINLSRFKGVVPSSFTKLFLFDGSASEGVCASDSSVYCSNLEQIRKYTKSGSPQATVTRTIVNGCNRPEDMFYYNGTVYVVQNNYPSTPRKAVVVKYSGGNLAYLGYIPLYNDHYAVTIARDDNGHWWLTGGANPVYLYHYDQNWGFIDSRVLVQNLGTYGYQGAFWRRGHLYLNTHYGNDDQFLDVWYYDKVNNSFTRIARVSHYIDGNQNGQGVKPDPAEEDVIWWVKSQYGDILKTKVYWQTSSVPFSLFNISFANGKAQMTTEPTENPDIATKKYVDDHAGSGTFLGLSDTPNSYSGQASKIVKVKSDESGLEFVQGGAGSFLDLNDTPDSYSGQASKVVRVKSDESGLEFVEAQAPGAHHTTHEAEGSDAIKLDDLAEPDDNTDLNATTSRHGLLPKLSGFTSHFLRGDGTWAEPSGGGGASAADISYYKRKDATGYTAWYAVPQFITNKGSTGWTLGSASRLYAQPLIIARATVIKSVAIYVTTAASGKKLTIGIYQDNGNMSPEGASLIDVFGEVDVGTTGAKQLDKEVSLDPGLYWFCFYSDGTPTIRAVAYTQVIHLLGFSGIDGACNSYFYKDETYQGGSMPSTFPSSPTMNTGQNIPMIFYLIKNV